MEPPRGANRSAGRHRRCGYILLREGRSTPAGSDIVPVSFLSRHLELRNAYLADLGHMIAIRSDGAEVLVDVGTGRQIISRDLLGMPIRAPGGGPLPIVDLARGRAAQMWEAVGEEPNDLDPAPVAEASPLGAPTGPWSECPKR